MAGRIGFGRGLCSGSGYFVMFWAKSAGMALHKPNSEQYLPLAQSTSAAHFPGPNLFTASLQFVLLTWSEQGVALATIASYLATLFSFFSAFVITGTASQIPNLLQ